VAMMMAMVMVATVAMMMAMAMVAMVAMMMAMVMVATVAMMVAIYVSQFSTSDETSVGCPLWAVERRLPALGNNQLLHRRNQHCTARRAEVHGAQRE
jgi:hypothetical protein